MSFGHRVIAGAFGLAILSLIVWGAFSTGHVIGKDTGEKEANTDSYARHAEQEIRQTCFNGDTAAATECIRRIIEATNEHERSEGDLEAQKSMALWALLMLIATVVMAVITGVGVFYVWRTLLATQEMARDTTNIGRDQMRAYVHADKAIFFWGNARMDRPRVEVWVRNTGATPARWYKIRLKPFVYDKKQSPIVKFPWDHSGLDAPLEGPWNAIPSDTEGTKATFFFDVYESDEISKASMDDLEIVIPQFGFSIFGEVVYETFFGEIFVSQFVFGRNSLPTYRLKETRQRVVDGMTVNNNIEEGIPLARYAADVATYQKQ